MACKDSGHWQDRPEEVRVGYHTAAIARLAQATSPVIATLLAIPDSFALLPGAAGPLSWMLRVLAVWLSALILWFAGYFCVMHLIAWLAQGITLNRDGIKLWRFGRLVPWRCVVALGVEPEVLFSRIFSLNPPASRLTLYIRKRDGGRLSPQGVPSILFLPDQFQSLVRDISQAALGVIPRSDAVLLACPTDLPSLKKICRFSGMARSVVSIVIAVSLTTFLARRATVNYLYNTANNNFAHGHYIVASRQYELVTSIDPYFAVAWQNLGGAEFQLGDRQAAVGSWQKALAIKPDFVEPKVSLSYVYMRERQYDKARELLERALRVAPRNSEVLTNLADLEMRMGHTRDAVNTARLALTINPGNQLAACLIAQGKLRQGKPQDALNVLVSGTRSGDAKPLAYCLEVEGEARLALGQLDQAEALFQSVLAASPRNSDALVYLAEVAMQRADWAQAETLLERACASTPGDPWTWLARSKLALKRGDRPAAQSWWHHAAALPQQDALSLATEADMALALGKTDDALALAERSIKIEPVTPLAVSVMDRLNPDR